MVRRRNTLRRGFFSAGSGREARGTASLRKNARRLLSAAVLAVLVISLSCPVFAQAESAGADALLTEIRRIGSGMKEAAEEIEQEIGEQDQDEEVSPRKPETQSGQEEIPETEAQEGQEEIPEAAEETPAEDPPQNSAASGKRVIDDAGLFTSAEIASMEEKIALLRQRRRIDAVIVTSRDIPANRSDYSEEQTRKWADDYYDQHGFGEGEDQAGFLYLIDMRNRVSYLSTAGVMIDYISDRRLEELLSDADPYLGRGQYGKAALSVLDAAERMMAAGIEEGHFRYDEATGQRLTGLYNRLTAGETVLAAAGGIAAALILYAIVSARYGLKRETYQFNQMTQSNVQLTRDEKTFLRQTVSRTRISSSGGSGGRSGGGGGGSGVHFSSGGHSHGGGGHHF